MCADIAGFKVLILDWLRTPTPKPGFPLMRETGFLCILGTGLEVGAGVNDSPVDCQSRERPSAAARESSPVTRTIFPGIFVPGIFLCRFCRKFDFETGYRTKLTISAKK